MSGNPIIKEAYFRGKMTPKLRAPPQRFRQQGLMAISPPGNSARGKFAHPLVVDNEYAFVRNPAMDVFGRGAQRGS